MKGNGRYGIGTRLAAVMLVLVMTLSFGAFTLREEETGGGDPAIFEETAPTPTTTNTPGGGYSEPGTGTESPAPSDPSAPGAITPEETADPEGTPPPEESPEATVTPEPSADPEVTVTPEPSAGPETTVTPEPSAGPEATVTPEPSAQPEGDMPEDAYGIMPIAQAPEPDFEVSAGDAKFGFTWELEGEWVPGETVTYKMTISNTGSEIAHSSGDSDSRVKVVLAEVVEETYKDYVGFANGEWKRPSFSYESAEAEGVAPGVSYKDSGAHDFSMGYYSGATSFLSEGEKGSADQAKIESGAWVRVSVSVEVPEGAERVIFPFTLQFSRVTPGAETSYIFEATADGVEDVTGKIDKVGLKYHLSAPNNEKSHGILIEGAGVKTISADLDEIFTGKTFDGTLSGGVYTDKTDTKHYFAGWSVKDHITDISETDYPVTDVTGSHRQYAEGAAPTITVPEGEAVHLYAVWETKPGLMGYSLSGCSSATFDDNGQDLLSAGNATDGSSKLVLRQSFAVGDKFSVSKAAPESNQDNVLFLAWYNKNPGTDYYVVEPGQTISYSESASPGTQFLDAVWARIDQGIEKDVFYEEASPSEVGIDLSDVIEFLGDSSADAYGAAFSTDNLVFTYSIVKDDKEVASGSQDDWKSATKTFKEPGTYVYRFTGITLVVPTSGSSVEKLSAEEIRIELPDITATLNIATEKAEVRYHLNDPTAADDASSTGTEVARTVIQKAGGTAGYVKTVPLNIDDEAFADSLSDLEKCAIKNGDKTYYFMGWTDDSNVDEIEGKLAENAGLSDIDFLISSPSGTERHIRTDEYLEASIKDGADLYAVWSEEPGMFGYTMFIEGADFAAGVKDKNLMEDAPTDWGARKYIDPAKTYKYDEMNEDAGEITLTEAIPTSGVPASRDEETGVNTSAVTFIAWHNKRANGSPGGSSYNSLNTHFFVSPGETVYFGDTSGVFSLDAFWGQATATDKSLVYDGNYHSVEDVRFKLVGPTTSTNKEHEELDKLRADLASENDHLQATYTVSVTTKDGEAVEEKSFESGSSVTTGVVPFHEPSEGGDYTYKLTDLPRLKEPGVYKYTITVEFRHQEPGGPQGGEISAEPEATVETTALLTITETGSLTVTKSGESDSSEDEQFTFTVTLSGDGSYDGTHNEVGFTDGVGTFSLAKGQSKTFERIPVGMGFSVAETEPGDYTASYAVDGNAASGAASGVIKSGGTTVTVTNSRPTPAPSPTPVPGATPTARPGVTSEPFYTPDPVGSSGPVSPPTGDGTAIVPWAVLLAFSAAGLAALLLRRRRQRG